MRIKLGRLVCDTAMTAGTIDNTVTVWVRRTFKERFFSLPWKPWCGWKTYEVTPASGSGVSVTVNPIVGPGLKMASEITFPPGTTIKKRLVRGGWNRAS